MKRFWRWWLGPLHRSTGVLGLLSVAATLAVILILVILAVTR